jgi:hypothetical protein
MASRSTPTVLCSCSTSSAEVPPRRFPFRLTEPGYCIEVTQGRTPPPAGGTADGRPYTDTEEQALSLAGELRERVHRERETVATLRAYLSGKRKPPNEKPGR